MYIRKIVEATRNINMAYIGGGIFTELACKYNPPVTETEIKKFEQEVARIPDDYKEFLAETNGMLFFGASDFSFYSLQEIAELQMSMNYKKGIYPIGYVLEDYIVIKSDEIYSGNYMYVGDAYCRDEYFALNCNFETFFDRYIMANANNYWRWQSSGEKFDFMK